MSYSFCFPTIETYGSAVGDTSTQPLLTVSPSFLTGIISVHPPRHAPSFRHRGRGGNKRHLPRCIRGRCLREPSNDAPKEAKLRGRQCPSSCVVRWLSFSGFTSDATQAWPRLLLFTMPHGQSSAPCGTGVLMITRLTRPSRNALRRVSQHWNACIMPKRRVRLQARVQMKTRPGLGERLYAMGMRSAAGNAWYCGEKMSPAYSPSRNPAM